MKRPLQPADPLAQQAPRHVDSPYLTTDQAREYLQLGSVNALYRLVREHGLPRCRLGRHYRFDRRELDAFLRGTTAVELRRMRKAG